MSSELVLKSIVLVVMAGVFLGIYGLIIVLSLVLVLTLRPNPIFFSMVILLVWLASRRSFYWNVH